MRQKSERDSRGQGSAGNGVYAGWGPSGGVHPRGRLTEIPIPLGKLMGWGLWGGWAEAETGTVSQRSQLSRGSREAVQSCPDLGPGVRASAVHLDQSWGASCPGRQGSSFQPGPDPRREPAGRGVSSPKRDLGVSRKPPQALSGRGAHQAAKLRPSFPAARCSQVRRLLRLLISPGRRDLSSGWRQVGWGGGG